MEEWKEIKGCDGYYEVSNTGRVRSWYLRGTKIGARADIPRDLKPYKNKSGHLTVALRGKNEHRFLIHRLVYMTFTKELGVDDMLDHINRNPENNNLSNLRLSNKSLNGYNRGKTIRNTSGYKGVSRNRDKWRATTSHLGRSYHFGTFKNKEDASEAYRKGINQLMETSYDY